MIAVLCALLPFLGTGVYIGCYALNTRRLERADRAKFNHVLDFLTQDITALKAEKNKGQA